jgi:hypothetical protein
MSIQLNLAPAATSPALGPVLGRAGLFVAAAVVLLIVATVAHLATSRTQTSSLGGPSPEAQPDPIPEEESIAWTSTSTQAR